MDQNIIQIYNNEDIKLFSKNLVDIALKTYWCIEKSKRYNLVFVVAISDTRSHFLFIIFWNPDLMISISNIKQINCLA